VKTHADIVDILRAQEDAIKTEFGIHEIGIVSPKVEYKPVADVCIFVEGVEPDHFKQLKSYLEAELDILVQLVEKASANGSFRYAFTDVKPKRA
jgi:hypothetical protein